MDLCAESDKHAGEAEGDPDPVEAALRDTAKHWHALVEHAPLGVVVVDEREHVLLWNPAAERIFGWKAEEVLGHPLPYLIPEHLEESAALHRDWLSGIPKANVDLHRLRKDGSLVHMSLDSIPLRDESGRVTRALALIRDLTEEDEVKARLQERERELLQAQKMEVVGRLAGGIAHNFNNLLTAIAGNADLLLASLAPEDERRAEIMEIADAAARAALLTRQLLAFSRRQIMRPRVVDLNEVIGGAVRLLHRLLGEDVHLVFEPSLEPAHVRADPAQIEQVVINLAINARDAMPHGGKVTIIITTVDTDETTSSLYGISLPSGRYRLFTVTDTGCGMDQETVSHVFEPFFTTKDSGKGTGLGLATVYGIVTQSGGWMGVESQPGCGTTMSVFLPAVDGERTRSSQEGREQRAGLSAKGGIILVEDEPSVLRLAERVLSADGYTVMSARSPAEVLEWVEQRGGLPVHDLLLTDVVLPGMDGWELARCVQSLSPSTRVMLMSGYPRSALPSLKERDDVRLLEKPFTPARLLKAVRDALEGPPGSGGPVGPGSASGD